MFLLCVTVHSDERPYPCNFCSSAFKSSSNRSKHERGSHSVEYQKRKRDREHSRNGEPDDSPPTPKKPKIEVTQSQSKVIKPSTATTPKKTEHPCRYCDRVFSRGDRRDTHETTHRDIRAFGEFRHLSPVLAVFLKNIISQDFSRKLKI